MLLDDNPALVPSIPLRMDASAAITFSLVGEGMRVGYHNTSLFVAGQWASMPSTDPAALLIGCAGGGTTGYYGYPSETCLPCPSGGVCDGFQRFVPTSAWINSYAVPLPASPGYAQYAGIMDSSITAFAAAAVLTNVDARGAGVHFYPRPLAGFFDLNGSMLVCALDEGWCSTY